MANKFVWYDLMTGDVTAAERFYNDVIGWTSSDAGIPDRPPYIIFSNGKAMAGGVMELQEQARAHGARPAWLGHIGVPDVDEYAARVAEAGGVVHRAPEDIPGIGRFAVVADPQGAAFVLFAAKGEAPPDAAPGEVGTVGWHELHAGDGAAAWEFYSGLFGWTDADAIDMGPQGKYQMFATGGYPVGGMMTRMPEMPAPMWIYYINVDAADAALARATAAGATHIMGPHQVPGGSWIVQCFDPQGAMFAMVSMTR